MKRFKKNRLSHETIKMNREGKEKQKLKTDRRQRETDDECLWGKRRMEYEIGRFATNFKAFGRTRHGHLGRVNADTRLVRISWQRARQRDSRHVRLTCDNVSASGTRDSKIRRSRRCVRTCRVHGSAISPLMLDETTEWQAGRTASKLIQIARNFLHESRLRADWLAQHWSLYSQPLHESQPYTPAMG